MKDTGGRGKIGETEIIRAHQPRLNQHSKYKWKKWFRRRASVEAIISHLKNDYGLCRNYLKGSAEDSINLMLSIVAFNFRKLLDKLSLFLAF
jgi:transposase, IS5 family